MKLKDKVAIITGSGRGLGRACAQAFSREGASVVILSRTPEEITGTATAIENEGGTVLAIRADVSNSGEVDEVVAETMSVFGRIDILMNNAAILGPPRVFLEINPEDWEQTMDINLKGVFLFSRAVIPQMKKQGAGKIINVTSGLAEIVMPPFGAYSVSKAGVNHVTRIMAEELRTFNIQVNALDPGIMDTIMQEKIRQLGPDIMSEAMAEQFETFHTDGHLKNPEDIASLAVFLASDESDLITGEIGSELDYSTYGYNL